MLRVFSLSVNLKYVNNLRIILSLKVICAELNKLWIEIAKLFHLQNVMKDYLSAITNRLNNVIEARRKMTPQEVRLIDTK